MQQHSLVFAWIWYFRQRTLTLIIYPWRKDQLHLESFDYYQKCLMRILSTFKKLLFFMRCRRNLQAMDMVVELPMYGHLCIPVHNGYKTFDLRKNMVIKVFDRDVETKTISAEIEELKKVSLLDFAPSLQEWSIDERWYQEEYVSGDANESSLLRLNTRAFLEKFHHDVLPCLGQLISWQKPMRINAVAYLEEIMRTVESTGLLKSQTMRKENLQIKEFLDAVCTRVSIEENLFVQLVYAHGDFCPANMLNTQSGMKVIDWEGAKYRSVLFDFYSYFFYRSVSGRVSIAQVVTESEEALSSMVSRIAHENQAMAIALQQSENVYRWLYYIERISMLIERKVTDKNLDISDMILRYLDAFNRCEEMQSLSTV